MKKIILLFAVLLQTTAIFAQQRAQTAELFLEISDRGKFTVYLNEEYAGSSQGRFRFFEVSDPNPVLTILQENRPIFKQRIRLQTNKRIIASYSQRRGFQISSALAVLNRGQYLLDDWDGNLNGTPGYPDGGYAMNPEDFKQFMNAVRAEHFDKDRIRVIDLALKNNYFSTKQVGEIIRSLDFEDQGLDVAKRAYHVTVDKNNYYTLKNSFKFLHGQDGLMDFLKNAPSTR
ncbi:hypothetical protein DBR11_03170 [Pedobacter sp. HMWF019]|uniref:DUF4476 domain-containing protein n=1 Tax=Pedobacter sp. HMWF019 TaxID=2056856 RepID=UPI000D39A318|nr:DUF4476 domain-containing protein [Pedobacter sp. HMWF019]PTT03095.1 hypothetical protein DBR11_03170 [Pedobacter sp. HMWF019]